MQEATGVFIDITYACRNQCSHCCVEATPDGESMSLSVYLNILRALNRSCPWYELCLTGGDIFLWRDGDYCFPHLLGGTLEECKGKGLRRIHFYISPFELTEDDQREDVLTLLKEGIEKGVVMLKTAFHLYDQLERKLLDTLDTLLDYASSVTLIVTIDPQNDYLTGMRLKWLMSQGGFSPNRPFELLHETMEWDPQIIFSRSRDGKEQKVVVEVNGTSRSGRASNLKEIYPVMGKPDCPLQIKPIEGVRRRQIYIALSGNVFSCYTTYPASLSPMGNINQEPLEQILRRYDKYKRQLGEHFRSNYLPTMGDFCTWCASTFVFKRP